MKLVWSALICFLIPLIIIYLLTNYLTRDIILEKAISNAEDSLVAAKSEINGIFEQTLELSNFVLMNRELRKILLVNQDQLTTKEQKQDYWVNYSRLSSTLDDLFTLKDDFYVTILGENNYIYTSYSYSEFNPTIFYGKEWFPHLKDMPIFSAYWLGEKFNYNNNSAHWITVGRPIKRTVNNHSIGYLVVNVNERIIRSHLANNADQEMILIDNNGVIISHTDQTEIGKAIPWWTKDANSQTIEIEGIKYIYAEQRLESNDWRVVSLIPFSAAIQKNKQILFISFTVQSLFFTLFFILLIILISALTKPIADLSKFVTNIGRGQLDERNGIRGNNEVGRLARTIDHMLDRIQSMFEQIMMEQAKKRKAELEMLQAQINPHFMFNLLNSIRLNILLQGDKENSELIGSLSSLLRMTINRDNELIPLQEEVDTVFHYVKLMNFRHANQVDLEYHFEDECGKALVPRFMIQPLIENSIIHGFEQFDGQIFINAHYTYEDESEYLNISVRDNGKGMMEPQLNMLRSKIEDEHDAQEGERKGFSGIGVKNVVQRLRLVYGSRFQVDIQSESDVGTVITLKFPSEVESAGGNLVDSNSSG
ncbi:sensor histidine kinase [Paenibacillus sp. FA6]|uniref:sensor histidine kinase n=1 Tax=Paenibacillus sp. FA6 TaxID=3413029 RepID=UPI003F6579E8